MACSRCRGYEDPPARAGSRTVAALWSRFQSVGFAFGDSSRTRGGNPRVDTLSRSTPTLPMAHLRVPAFTRVN